MRLIQGEAPALCLAVVSGIAVTVARRRAEHTGGLAGATRVAALTAVAVLVCYLPYGVFPDWSYLRFLLPAFPIA
jgi:hypothetical protein